MSGARSIVGDNFRYDLNGLRALSIIIVILFHYNFPKFSIHRCRRLFCYKRLRHHIECPRSNGKK